MRLLFVDEDALLAEALKVSLLQFGYLVECLNHIDAAKRALKTEHFDLLLLGESNSKPSGFNLPAVLRSEGLNIPIIILSNENSPASCVRHLDDGADDYVRKPFDLNELCARIRALIRRSQGRSCPILEYENIKLNPGARSVTLNDQPIDIQRREFALLQKLLENRGNVLSREHLMQSIYGWNEDLNSNALEVHIHHLRKKLHLNAIRTVRGIGYMIP